MTSQPKDPLVTKIETYAGVTETAILWGYLGDVVDNVQTLYIDLTRQRWIDISINDIKTSEHLGAGRGSLVWVAKYATVTQVALAPASTLDVALGFLAGNFVQNRGWIEGDDPPGPPRTTAKWRC